MAIIAGGDGSAEVPEQGRGDEIGTLARGLESLRKVVDDAFRLNQMVNSQAQRTREADCAGVVGRQQHPFAASDADGGDIAGCRRPVDQPAEDLMPSPGESDSRGGLAPTGRIWHNGASEALRCERRGSGGERPDAAPRPIDWA